MTARRPAGSLTVSLSVSLTVGLAHLALAWALAQAGTAAMSSLLPSANPAPVMVSLLPTLARTAASLPGPRPLPPGAMLAPRDANPLPRDMPHDVTPEVAREMTSARPPSAASVVVDVASAPVVVAAPPAAAEAPSPASVAPPPAPPAVVLARADHRQCAPAPYPALLRERGIEGSVVLRVKVDTEGRAADVQMLAGSGWRLFDEAALQRVRGCRFFPARRGDETVDSWVEFPVRFALASG